MENFSEIEILLVEDNQNDAEMALRALKKNNLSNQVMDAVDGEEALDFIFAKGKFASMQKSRKPNIILLDLTLQKRNNPVSLFNRLAGGKR